MSQVHTNLENLRQDEELLDAEGLREQKALRNKKDKGQGMTEYIIIVALIAIAAIGVVTVFGQNIREIFGASTAALAGETTVQSKAKRATSNHTGARTLKDFGKNNKGN